MPPAAQQVDRQAGLSTSAAQQGDRQAGSVPPHAVADRGQATGHTEADRDRAPTVMRPGGVPQGQTGADRERVPPETGPGGVPQGEGRHGPAHQQRHGVVVEERAAGVPGEAEDKNVEVDEVQARVSCRKVHGVFSARGAPPSVVTGPQGHSATGGLPLNCLTSRSPWP